MKSFLSRAPYPPKKNIVKISPFKTTIMTWKLCPSPSGSTDFRSSFLGDLNSDYAVSPSSITTERPGILRYLPIISISTWRALCWETWRAKMQSLSPQCHHWVACYFKTISQLHLYKSSVLGDFSGNHLVFPWCYHHVACHFKTIFLSKYNPNRWMSCLGRPEQCLYTLFATLTTSLLCQDHCYIL